jgi:hypothetical protein
MTTDYHTAMDEDDVVDIPAINSRLAELDQAIVDGFADSSPLKVAQLYEREATGVDGGAASATTWHTRALNQEVDPLGIVTLSSHQFTPVAGDYVLMAEAVGYQVGEHRLKLYNEGQSSDVTPLGPGVDSGAGSVAYLYSIFTADGEDAYTLQHYTKSAKATDGLGKAVGDGSDEVYATVILIKIG